MDLIQDISLLMGVDNMDESRQGEAYASEKTARTDAPKMYMETYGCQMNFSDTEIVASIMTDAGYSPVENPKDANVIFINTCSIRENAEEKVRNRLQGFRSLKKRNEDVIIGVLGCMAERLKSKLLEQEKLVDVVVGPDAYRDLPRLISQAESGQKAVNVFLSLEETYADISPVRLNSNGVTAFVTIMRGCDNMCSFCVVPFTRGRERSREPKSIVKECEDLFAQGYREVTLLGQNVDSYSYENGMQINFAELLEMIARISPQLRVRFSTSHPKDISDELLETIAKYDNICNFIHLPVQSGNNRILQLMNRGYTREWYRQRIETARKIIPNPGLSTDIITGFCSETEEEHRETLSLMGEIEYDHAFMFKYSERPATPAAKKLKDDIPNEVKTERLNEIILLQNKISRKKNQEDIGKVFRVLIESDSKRSAEHFCGRNDANKMIVFAKKEGLVKSDYVNVKIISSTSATLLGEII